MEYFNDSFFFLLEIISVWRQLRMVLRIILKITWDFRFLYVFVRCVISKELWANFFINFNFLKWRKTDSKQIFESR